MDFNTHSLTLNNAQKHSPDDIQFVGFSVVDEATNHTGYSKMTLKHPTNNVNNQHTNNHVNNQPGATSRSLRKNAQVDPKVSVPPDYLLHEPPPSEMDRIQPKQTRRVTPTAKAFIIQLINSGYSNRSINSILRERKFILPREPDLHSETIRRIRALDVCHLDADQLSEEARQTGYNHIGRTLVFWADVLDAVEDRLFHGGDFGKEFEGTTLLQLVRMAKTATDILHSTFAAGLGERIRKELEDVLSSSAVSSESAPVDKDELLKQVIDVAAIALERALADSGVGRKNAEQNAKQSADQNSDQSVNPQENKESNANSTA